MSQKEPDLAKRDEFDKSNRVLAQVSEEAKMAPEDRRRVVLRFLAEHNLALKPKTIYRNLRFHHRITFGDETVKNILHELVNDGHARRVDPNALEDGKLEDLARGEGRGAYIVTDDGREEIYG